MKKLLLLTAIIAGTAFFFTASAQQGYRYGNDRDYGYGHDYHKEYFKWRKHHARDSYEDFCRMQRWNEGYRNDQRFESSRPGSYNNYPGNGGYSNGGYNNGGYNNGGSYNNPGSTNGNTHPGGTSGYGNSSNSGSGTRGGNGGYGTQGGGRTSSHRGY